MSKEYWHIIDIDTITKEKLITLMGSLCSYDKQGRRIVWLEEKKAEELGLTKWQKES